MIKRIDFRKNIFALLLQDKTRSFRILEALFSILNSPNLSTCINLSQSEREASACVLATGVPTFCWQISGKSCSSSALVMDGFSCISNRRSGAARDSAGLLSPINAITNINNACWKRLVFITLILLQSYLNDRYLSTSENSCPD